MGYQTKGVRQNIIVSENPRGVFMEGTIVGTPVPGTCMSQNSTAADGTGRMAFIPWTGGADGALGEVWVLREDWAQGKGSTDAYVTGSRGFLYCPVAGDELLVLFGNVAGTADDVAVGDLLMIDDTTGKVINLTGSPARKAFIALEAYVDPIADKLILCRYTGS